MELFIQQNDQVSSALEILARYIRADKHGHLKLIQLGKGTLAHLGLKALPFLIQDPNQEPVSITYDLHDILKTITTLCKLEKIFLGETPYLNKQIQTWVTQSLTGNPLDLISQLNDHLLTHTFIVNPHVTAADIFLFIAILKDFPKESQAFPNVLRWIVHVQLLPSLNEILSEKNLIVSFKEEVKVNKGQEKKTQKQEYAQKKKEGQSVIKELNEELQKLDIRVGRILSIQPNAESDLLFNSVVDIGHGNTLNILLGLRGKVKQEDLQDSLCTLLVNLRPKTIKGYESKGMLLTATSGEETQILNPPVTSHPGELVYFTGVERKPPEFLPARKNAWNKTQPEMKTREDGIACWTDVVLTTDKGDIKSIENGIIG